jgi:ABC-2 type transport system permease protein
MRGILVLWSKELKDAFYGPFVYILTALFSATIGWLFFNYILASGNQSTTISLTNKVLAPTFGNMNFIFIFLAPLITMRLFSEEKKQSTLDLLFQSDLNNFQIIVAKFLSSLTISLFMLSMTIIFPIILALSGYADWGIVATSYAGIIFSLMCYLSVGLFASSLTENQIVAAVLGFCFLLGLMLLVITAQAVDNTILTEIFQYTSTPFHFENFLRGSVRSFSLVYFVSFIGFFFYLTHLSLDSRNW